MRNQKNGETGQDDAKVNKIENERKEKNKGEKKKNKEKKMKSEEEKMINEGEKKKILEQQKKKPVRTALSKRPAAWVTR